MQNDVNCHLVLLLYQMAFEDYARAANAGDRNQDDLVLRSWAAAHAHLDSAALAHHKLNVEIPELGNVEFEKIKVELAADEMLFACKLKFRDLPAKKVQDILDSIQEAIDRI